MRLHLHLLYLPSLSLILKNLREVQYHVSTSKQLLRSPTWWYWHQRLLTNLHHFLPRTNHRFWMNPMLDLLENRGVIGQCLNLHLLQHKGIQLLITVLFLIIFFIFRFLFSSWLLFFFYSILFVSSLIVCV